MSSCVKPMIQKAANPLVLLHGFDRYTLPRLEQAGYETWAIDILGWGFSDLAISFEYTFFCSHANPWNLDVYISNSFCMFTVFMLGPICKFWKSYIGRPMMLVGPSLGAAVAIDFAINHPEAVDKLILIDASVYAEGTGTLSRLPKFAAYAGRLHCELPNAIIRQIPKCGHYPHVEKPHVVTNLIKDFIETNNTRLPLFSKPEEKLLVPQLE
ncbi:hypothetical protein L1987_06660 [Smallanthus sonchifolius]|uniref:Uncharacterized protein n=1 Tax=Smallanthus sonchifolius TaxID=185202 RepID=A0ACB9JZ44_9ASTR|nr:hypothetical protein L1987_06660 [Smallanthus sonchifolius]